MSAMKEQMKYYINFAENSIHGHLDGKPRNMEAEHEAQVESLVKEMQIAKEQIRNLSSHNSELRSQLEVLAATATAPSSAQSTRESSRGLNTPVALNESEYIHPSTSTRESSTSPSLPLHVIPKSREASDASLSSDSSELSLLASAENVGSDSLQTNDELVKSSASNIEDMDPRAQGTSHNQPTNETFDTIAFQKSENTALVLGNAATIPPLSPEVALLKLQQKFKKAMQDNVELSTEKEQLEHLVIQLQEETETIGEYITIYQHQRRQQKLNLAEKEAQLQSLSRDREELKSKLSQLQLLVKHFIKAEKQTPLSMRTVNDHRHNLLSNNHLSSMASSTTSFSSDNGNDSTLSSSPSTPRNIRSELPKVNQILSIGQDNSKLTETELIENKNGYTSNDNGPTTKAVLIDDKSDTNFIVTSIPEGADLRNNLSDGVNEIRTIILPESESNCAEEVVIVPQKDGIASFDNPADISNQQTADKILALISEIGSNQILNKEDKNFHPWFWDSSNGPVMTI